MGAKMIDGERGVHWFTRGAVRCGAPETARWSYSTHGVTCPDCRVGIRMDWLRQRAREYGRSLGIGIFEESGPRGR